MSAATSTAGFSFSSPHSDELYVNLPKCWKTIANKVKRSMVGWVQAIGAKITEHTLVPGQTLRIGSDNTLCNYPLKINNLSGVYFELAVTNEDITFKNIMLPSVKVEGVEIDVGKQTGLLQGFHIVIPGCTTTFVVHKLELTTVDDNSDDAAYNAWAQEDFIMTNTELGAGAYGSVCLGFDISTSKRIAIKTIFGNHQYTASEEVNTLKELSGHPYFIQMIDTHTTFQAMYIVLQHAWGHLGRYIRLHVTVPEECAKVIFKQLLKGIKIMHDKNLVHGDIKPGNILLLEFSQAPTAVYADFGLTKKLASSISLLTSFDGTLEYMAPEKLNINDDWEGIKSDYKHKNSITAQQLELPSVSKDGYGKPSDMWSLGITLFQMVFGKLPFGKPRSMVDQLHDILIINADTHNKDGRVSNQCMELIHNLLKVDSDKRYTAEEALACAWLAGPAAEEASPPAPLLQQSLKRKWRKPSIPTRIHYPRKAKRGPINYNC